MRPMLSLIALISGLYDIVVGAFLLLAADHLATLFGVPPASPRIFSDLNGLFLLAVGIGYALPWREPQRYRGTCGSWARCSRAPAPPRSCSITLPGIAAVVPAVRRE